MVLLPSAAMFTVNSSSPIAWGFLGIEILRNSTSLRSITDFAPGPDGSVVSLHCEVRTAVPSESQILKRMIGRIPRSGAGKGRHPEALPTASSEVRAGTDSSCGCGIRQHPESRCL